jgi:hypothetical protein
LNDPSDTDEYWTVEIAFPFKAMAEHAHKACPPKDGDQWRLGFSRVEWGYRIVDGKYVRRPGKQERADDWHEDNWVWSPQGVVNMHRPETWGYVQFSSQPVGNEVEFQPGPTAAARYLIHQAHYAQADFYERNKRYAQNLAQLGLDELTHVSLASPITMEVSETGFVVTAKVKIGDELIKQVTIDETARIHER